MGRKKVIEDNVLINLIQKFYQEQCNGRASKLKLPAIVEYVKAAGYPDYAIESLRRNAGARKYIDSLKEIAADTSLEILVTYKTLDVREFLLRNKTKAALTNALTELDGYYKTIAALATEVNKKYQSLKAELEKTVDELRNAREEIDRQQQTIVALKAENKMLAAEKQTLKRVVDDYVYPDIANELLAKNGLLSHVETVIAPEKLEGKIVHGDTEIEVGPVALSESNVIRGLFDIRGDS